MYLLFNNCKISPPSIVYHDPKLTNKFGSTVAMLIA